jgi:hypothetical protein
LTIGLYETFPENLHLIANYTVIVSIRQLQQRLLKFIGQINRQEFLFEQVSIPTIPNGVLIFEFGLADVNTFTFLDAIEIKKAIAAVGSERVHILDFFCSIRYYKSSGEKRVALKFDYYMLRGIFGKGKLEMQVFHERGPRYLSPEDLTGFLLRGINGTSNRKIVREITP